MPTNPSYRHAEEGYSADVVRDNRTSYSAAVRDASSTARDDVGRGSRTKGFVGVVGILGRGFIGPDYSSVEFLKPAPPLTADLAYSLTEAMGGAGYAAG
jgi:hypothetical protein